MVLARIKKILSLPKRLAGYNNSSRTIGSKLFSNDGAEGERIFKRVQQTGIKLPEHGLELKRDPETDIVYLLEYNEKGFGNFYTLLPLSKEDADNALKLPNSLNVYHQTRRWQISNQFPIER